MYCNQITAQVYLKGSKCWFQLQLNSLTFCKQFNTHLDTSVLLHFRKFQSTLKQLMSHIRILKYALPHANTFPVLPEMIIFFWHQSTFSATSRWFGMRKVACGVEESGVRHPFFGMRNADADTQKIKNKERIRRLPPFSLLEKRGEGSKKHRTIIFSFIGYRENCKENAADFLC